MAEPQYKSYKPANVSISSSGNNTVIAAVANESLAVQQIFLYATGSVSLYITDGTNSLLGDGTNKITIDPTGVDGAPGLVLPASGIPWLVTGKGLPLIINLSSAVGVAGKIWYDDVTDVERS